MDIKQYREHHEGRARYLERHCERNVASKLVVCHKYTHYNAKWCGEYESWCGDWWMGCEPHFLVEIFIGHDDKYSVYCTGTDDDAQAARGLSLEEAKALYDKVVDGISKKMLQKLGIVYE